MPVTIETAPHRSNSTYMCRDYFSENPQELYARGQRRGAAHESLLQSSFTDQDCKENSLYASPNGFVFAAIDAYNEHHHLTIRPDDIWFAILSQFGCWMKKAAEDVRKLFVAHDGKKELWITYDDATRFTVDFGKFARQMTEKIEENIVDPGLREWMMPNFSTTTDTDTVVASVLMMGVLQPFFAYGCCTACGIPSVTLLGERSDWDALLGKLDKLATFGEEPAKFVTLLRPICQRFVDCFDDAQGEKVKSFWGHIVSEISSGSGCSYYSGWLTAFCFWDKDGNNLYDQAFASETLSEDEKLEFYESDDSEDSDDEVHPRKALEMDGVKYHPLNSSDVPPGFASVPVKLIDNGLDGKVFETSLVAGSVGMQYTASGDCKDGGLDSLQPVAGWWMFIDKEIKD